MLLFRDLWAAAPRRTGLVVCLIVLGSAGQALGAAVAGAVLVDRSVSAFAVLSAAIVVAVLGDVIVGLVMAGVTADWSASVRRRLCRAAFGQDLPTLETTPVGEVLDRIDGDVSQVGHGLRASGVRITQAVATGVLSVATALVIWWPAGLAMLGLTGVLVVALYRPTKRIAPARMAEEEAWSDLAAVMEEAIHGQDDVRTSLARPYVLRLYARRASEVMRRGRIVWKLSAQVATAAGTAIRVVIAAVVLVGVWAMLSGRMDGARLTAIWLLALAFGATIDHISRHVPELQYALGAWNRIQLLRGSRQEPAGGAAPTPGDLVIRGLTYRYPNTEACQPALRDVRVTFRRGRSYAVIGRTGSGKSTLAKVLTRAVEVPAGTVYLGERDVLELDLEPLRRFVAIVPQRTEILAGTLAENIALFDPALLGRAERALHELGLGSWVADLPDGVHTRLGDGGTILSAGQEQLVAFARILVRDPHVVILDEATARMDPVTEAQVQRATERLLRDRIGIVIAHRLSSVRRCDEVVVLADGAVVEAGPLRESERFARLLSSSMAGDPAGNPAAEPTEPAERVPALVGAQTAAASGAGTAGTSAAAEVSGSTGGAPAAPSAQVLELSVPAKTDPPPIPSAPPARAMREIFRLVTNDPRVGLVSVALFTVMVLLGLDGSVLPWLFAAVVDGTGSPWWPAIGVAVGLLLSPPMFYCTGIWFPDWWTRQMLRIGLRLVHGQTGPRRVSSHTPAEVVAQGGDTERVVNLADNMIDHSIAIVTVVSITVLSGSIVPGLFFAGTMVISGLAATLFGPKLERSARRTVAARAAFATALVSSLSAARTVKLAGATGSVLGHLAGLDRARSEQQRREISIQVYSRSTPSVLSGLSPLAVWALFLAGELSAAGALIAVSTLGAARWFAWTSASLVSQLPSARVWTRRTVAMAGTAAYSASVPGVDLVAGTAPAPPSAPRHPLRRLDLSGFTAIHEDGTLGVRDVRLTVERGQLVLVLGAVGSGKSSLLRALAGIVHHTGTLRWNGQPVTEPELFLRPNQVGYVGQLPRVLSGTVADNVQLGHDVDARSAVGTAQLDHDLAVAGGTGGGLGLLIGHKGTRLSGGQLQRLALARALAPRTELLIADDVSSALDVTTELELWRALREHGVTVVGSTSKRAALALADRVVVLQAGEAVDQGTWSQLRDRWGHLAG